MQQSSCAYVANSEPKQGGRTKGSEYSVPPSVVLEQCNIYIHVYFKQHIEFRRAPPYIAKHFAMLKPKWLI